MGDPSVTTREELASNQAHSLSAQNEEDKLDWEKKPMGRHLKGVGPMYKFMLQEEEAEIEKLAALGESIKSNGDNDITPQTIEMVKAGGAGLAPVEKEHDQIQVGEAGLWAKPKEKKWKEKKERKKEKKKGRKEDEEKKRKGQINSAKRHVKSVNEKYIGFLDDANLVELEKIANILNEMDENSWDDAVNTSLSARIQSVMLTAKERLDEDMKTSQRIVELEETLDHEVKGTRGEAERRVAQADNIQKLVSKFKISVMKLEHQRSLVPTKEIERKGVMSKKLLLWLEQKLERLRELMGYNDLVDNIVAWDKELLDKTFWDRSLKNMEKTESGRKAIEDYENTKFERLIFNPSRTSFPHFIQYMTDRVCDHPQYGFIESREGNHRCPVLEFQTKASKQPPRWMILQMQSGPAKASTHMRSDNLYIGGFGNQNDQLYELANKKHAPLMKGAIPFECACDYTSLMNFERTKGKPPPGQDVDRLKKLILNMSAVDSDIIAMSKYDHREKKKTTPQKWKEIIKEVQIAIARTAITFPEVCRFLAIFASVKDGWLSETGSYLNDLLIHYMRHWKVVSYAVRNDFEGKMFTIQEIKDLGITYAFQGFQILRVALNSAGEGLLKEDNSNGDGPKPPPPGDDDEESEDDGGKGPENESGMEKEAKDHGSRGGTIKPAGTKNEAVDSQGDSCELCGQVLLEILSVHTNTNRIKSISLYDGRGGQVIYKSSEMDLDNFNKKRDSWLSSHTEMDSCDYMEELLMTGPDRVMSGLPRYGIEVDVGDENQVFDLWSNWSDRSVINKPMTQSVFTSQGDVHLTSVVFSNAVEAYMEFLFFIPPSKFRWKLEVQGNLVLQIEDFPIGTKIFQNDLEGGFYMTLKKSSEMTAEEDRMIIKEAHCTVADSRIDSGLCMKLPLNRDVFALPIGCGLRVTGSLVLKDSKEVTVVSVDEFIAWRKDQVNLYKLSPSCASGYLMGSRAAILINATCPF